MMKRRKRMNWTARWLGLVIVMLMVTGFASAEVIQNPGFEDQVLSENGYRYGTEGINWWDTNYAPDRAYIVHPGDTWSYVYPNSGDNVLVLVNDAYAWQNSPAMVAGQTYTLSAHVSALSGLDTGYYILSLLNTRTGTHVASITSMPDWTASENYVLGSMAAAGTWLSIQTPSYTATAEDAGHVLTLALWSVKPSYVSWDATSFVAWDDLSLSVVPEPATMSLLGLGGMMLIRKRLCRM